MHWIWLIIVGAIVGALGRLLHPGIDPMGWLLTILIGIGALMGGTIAGFITHWLFVWWLGAFGIFMLGRTLRAPVWGAFVVALGFVMAISLFIKK